MRLTRAGALAAALAIVAVACSSSAEAPTTTLVPSSTVATTAGSATTASTTTSLPPDVNPLTDTEIRPEQVAIMPLPELTGALNSYEIAADRPEPNARLAQLTVVGVTDERNDIETWGRVDGHRTVLTAPVTSAIPVVETWVSVFSNDAGAAGYLLDFSGDVEKRQDTGRKGAITVLDTQTFAVDAIGDGAIGIVALQQSEEVGDGFETVIGFRMGRILGFVSLLATDDRDLRVATQLIAEQLATRIEGVVTGAIVPPDEVPPPALSAFSFTFEQSVMETFLVTVFPDFDPDDLDDPTTTSTGSTTTTSGDTTTTTIGADTTTTTTRIERRTSTGRVTATGTVVGDDLDCTVTFEVFGIQDPKSYVVAAGDTWLQDATTDGAYRTIEQDETPAATDLIYCPGWDPAPSASGLDAFAVLGSGTLEDLDGITAERFDLGRDALVAIGYTPSVDTGPDLDRFTVWLNADPEEPWIVGLELALSGDTRQFERALGPGFTP
ncbi:MAG: hypothetical protein KJP12_05280, partial [Acidimicrobiia bacterium]|nr:hypothetical protein [Acidimicrobiia bacterium]